MRREFPVQNFSLFLRSLKSLFISAICKSYVYTLIMVYDSKPPGPDEAQVSAPSVLELGLSKHESFISYIYTRKFKL